MSDKKLSECSAEDLIEHQSYITNLVVTDILDFLNHTFGNELIGLRENYVKANNEIIDRQNELVDISKQNDLLHVGEKP